MKKVLKIYTSQYGFNEKQVAQQANAGKKVVLLPREMTTLNNVSKYVEPM